MTDPVTDTPTDPLFIGLASILAAIESGIIAEGDVNAVTVTEGRESTITITVRRETTPIIVEGNT